jgi:cation diffusion facilitator CzcD-associated flavoprotein CzcO
MPVVIAFPSPSCPPPRAEALTIARVDDPPPERPDLPGLDEFAGHILHAADWDPGCPLPGRQIALIGDGHALARLIPHITPQLRHLTVFQPEPVWVAPRMTSGASDHGHRWLAAWPDLLNGLMEQACRLHLRLQIPTPDLRRRLTPGTRCDSRRLIYANDYYPVFNRPNVTLCTEAIARIRPGSIETVHQRRHPVDTLILATERPG